MNNPFRRGTPPPAPGADRAGNLHVAGLYAGYGTIPVLRDITLTVAQGESVALLGANGAGKTTFLRTISGLIKPTAGTVTYHDTDLTGQTPQRILQHGIAHVPQGRQVFASQNVRENLQLGARLRKDNRIADDLTYVLDTFPALKDKINQAAGDLSGGQQQALAIARALMSDPALLLLDEPSIGLAPRLVDDLGQLLITIQQDRGTSMLIVEQDTLLALELTTRAYVIQRGQITLQRPSKTLTEDPAIVFAYLGGETPDTTLA